MSKELRIWWLMIVLLIIAILAQFWAIIVFQTPFVIFNLIVVLYLSIVLGRGLANKPVK